MTRSSTPAPLRGRRGPPRLDAFSGLVVILGIALLGSTWSVIASRASEREQTQSRIAQMETHGSKPADLPHVVSASAVPPVDLGVNRQATPPTTPSVTSNDEPLLEASAPPPTPGATAKPTSEGLASTPQQLQPLPTAVGRSAMPPPTHITIAAAGIDTDVVQVSAEPISVEDRTVLKWQVADYTAGHHDTSANPGEGGNIVIAGHDDYHGAVFRGLHDIQIGDLVTLTTSAGQFSYVVVEVHLRQEKGMPLDDRLAIGVWMQPMPEERLTLITCWPYGVDDHRMIVVAKPVTDAVTLGGAP